MDVFISYKREEIRQAQRIEQALAEEGYSTFLDVGEGGIRAGEAWVKRLEKELQQAPVCLALTSPASVRSEPVMREVRTARQRRTLIPVYVRPTKDTPPELHDDQAVKLFDWNGDRRDARWRFLVEGIAAKTGKQPRNAPAREDIYIAMVQAMQSKGKEARTIVEDATRKAILSHTAGELMTFQLSNGRVLKPEASIDYLKALVLFMAGQKMDGATIDSAISADIAKAAEQSLQQYLASEAIMRTLLGPIDPPSVSGDAVAPNTQKLTRKEAAFVGREIANATSGLTGVHMLHDQALKIGVDQAVHFFMHTAAGATVLAALQAAISTAAGKIAVANLTKSVILKLASSAAAKTAVMGVLKKVGIAAVIKIALIKTLAILAPKLALGKVAVASIVFAVLLPILAAFVAHDIEKMPEKLAKKVPEAVGDEIERAWPGISNEVTANILLTATRDAVSVAKVSPAPVRPSQWGAIAAIAGALIVIAASVFFFAL